MRFFSLFLSVLILSAVMSAQKRYLVSPNNELTPIDPGMSAASIIADWQRHISSTARGDCPDVFYFGYTPTNYPIAGNSFGATHKDVMGQWYVAPATGTIDTVFWLTGSVNKSYDSTLFLRIHRSNISNDYGPGVRPGPFNPPCQNWGYWNNTNDGDQQVAAFIEEATDTAWVSTINGSPIPSGPPFAEELWGFGGVALTQHVNTINWYSLQGLGSPAVTTGDKFFISLRMNFNPADPGGHRDESATSEWTLFRYATWRASTADEDYPSRNWKFYEHDKGPSDCSGFPVADIRRGWVPRGSTSGDTLDNVVWSQWYSMSVTSNVPPAVDEQTDLHTTFDTGDQIVTALITDCNPANPPGAGVVSASIKWTLDNVTQPDIPMLDIGLDTWEGTLPGQPIGSIITWKIVAKDNDNAEGLGPPDNYSIVPFGTEWFSIDTGYACVTNDISSTGTEIDTSAFFRPSYFAGTNVPVPKDDGTAGPVDMGDDYVLFGDAFRYAWVGVNGAIALSKTAIDTIDVNSNGFATTGFNFPGAQHHSSSIVDSFTLGNMPPMFIAPMWADHIIGDSAGQYGKILYGNDGDTCLFIVQWDSIGAFTDAGPETDITTFRVVLNRCTGIVEYQYESVGAFPGSIDTNITSPGYGGRIDAVVGLQADSNAVSGPVPGWVFYNRLGYPLPTRLYDGTCVRFYPKVGTNALDDWNIVAVSMTPNDANYAKTVLFPSAVSPAYRYSNGYVVADPLTKGQGVWMKFDGAGGVGNSPGTFDHEVTATVDDKWNLIGGPSGFVGVGSIQVTGGTVSSSYFGYGASGYYTAPFIQPGNGYWVKMNGAGTLQMVSYAAAPKAEPMIAGTTDLAGLNKVTIQDATGRSQTIYLGSEGQIRNELSFFEMPPAPPAGGFDVRFQSQRMVESYPEMLVDGQVYQYPISVSGAVYPVVVRWEINSPVKGARKMVLSDLVDGKSIQQIMDGSGSFMIKSENAKNFAVKLSEGINVPATFALSQNYPNPFNPVTHFTVALPRATEVEVAVYDLLGRKIASLMSGNQAAGEYTLEWNGRDGNGVVVPTGMYFLRMSSDEFNTARKIMLMK